MSLTSAPGLPQRGRIVSLQPRQQARQEYVAGDIIQAYQRYAKSLPPYVDDISRDLGLDVYAKMLGDDAVASAMGTLQTEVLRDGVHLSSAIAEKDKDGFAQAATYTVDCERMLANLTPSLDAVLWDMTRAFAYGYRVAEQVYELERVPSGAQRLVLHALKVKPPRATAFVVDPFTNVLGLLGLIPGTGLPVNVGLIMDKPETVVNFIPREKFAILTVRSENNDPRGQSLLRAAYLPFYDKISLAPELVKYLSQFGTPSIMATLAETAAASALLDVSGQPIISTETGLPIMRDPMTELATALADFRNSSILALPFGTQAQVLESQADGSAYLAAFDRFDRRITQALHYQTLSTMEGVHQTRAASGTHENRLDTLVAHLRLPICEMLRRDVLQQYLRLNYGDAAVELAPLVTLGPTQQEDRTDEMAIAVKAGYRLGRSQFAGLDERYSMPERDPDEDPVQLGETVAVAEQGPSVGPQGEQNDDDNATESDDQPAQPTPPTPARQEQTNAHPRTNRRDAAQRNRR